MAHRADSGPRVEHNLRIMTMIPDGRCMFRAIATGLNHNQGQMISKSEIEEEASKRTPDR